MEKPDDDAALVDARITLPPDIPWPMHRDFLVALGMRIAPDAAAPPAGTTLSTSIALTSVPTGAVQRWFDSLHELLPELAVEWWPNGSLADPEDEYDEYEDALDDPEDPTSYEPEPETWQAGHE